MTMMLPAVEWPAALRGEGPVEDRRILLRGEMMIAPARFVLTAVRVDPIRLAPDNRDDLGLAVYTGYDLPH
jgi:hypothetical protein